MQRGVGYWGGEEGKEEEEMAIWFPNEASLFQDKSRPAERRGGGWEERVLDRMLSKLLLNEF